MSLFGSRETSPEGYSAIAPLNSGAGRQDYNGTASTPPVMNVVSRQSLSFEQSEEKEKKKDDVSWKKIANKNRFFHEQIEVDVKVDGKQVKKAAKKKKEKEENEKKKAEFGGETTSVIKSDHSKKEEASVSPSAGAAYDDAQGRISSVDSTGTERDQRSLSLQSNFTHYEEPCAYNATRPGHTKKTSLADVPRPKEFPQTNAHRYAYFKPKDVKKPGRRICFFDGKLKRVSKIDTCEETFHVVFHYYFTWLMSKDEVNEIYEAQATEEDFEAWKPRWYPEVECDNLVEGDIERKGVFKIKEGVKFGCLKSQNPSKDFAHGWGWTSFDISGYDLGFDPRWAFWCRVQYECRITCAEEMELEMFPFDCQDLSVVLRSSKKANEVDFLPFPRKGEIFNIDAKYSMVSEWRIPGVMLEFVQGDPKQAKNGIPYNSVIVRVKAERKWEAHMADSVTIFCMFWLGLATFGMPVEDVGDRLAYCITLLLTDVATMQLLNESIPNIPYRTFLDNYTYGCFLFLVAVTVWVTIAGFGGDKNLGYNLDWYAFWVCTGLVFLMHLQFAYSIWQGKKEERAKLTLDTQGLEDWFEEMRHEGSTSSVPTAAVSWDSRSIRATEQWNEYCRQKGLNVMDEGTSWTGLSYPWSKPGEEQFQKVDHFNVQKAVCERHEPAAESERPPK